MHIETLASKLKSRYGVDVELDVPRIPYRETIKKKATAEGKHKKQSGGSGQFGVVTIDFEPTFDLNVPIEFVDKVSAARFHRQYIPAVEKGLRKAIEKGVLAEYPLVGLRATLLDGKYHPVDSDEMSFMMAASLAYKEGIHNASPVLLEPIYKISITVPDKYMGDIMGDLSKNAAIRACCRSRCGTATNARKRLSNESVQFRDRAALNDAGGGRRVHDGIE
jgi:elongation factor G